MHDVMPHLGILKREKSRHARVSLCYVKRGLGRAHQAVYFGYGGGGRDRIGRWRIPQQINRKLK